MCVYSGTLVLSFFRCGEGNPKEDYCINFHVFENVYRDLDGTNLAGSFWRKWLRISTKINIDVSLSAHVSKHDHGCDFIRAVCIDCYVCLFRLTFTELRHCLSRLAFVLNGYYLIIGSAYVCRANLSHSRLVWPRPTKGIRTRSMQKVSEFSLQIFRPRKEWWTNTDSGSNFSATPTFKFNQFS